MFSVLHFFPSPRSIIVILDFIFFYKLVMVFCDSFSSTLLVFPVVFWLMPHLSTSGLLKVRTGQSPDLVRGNRGGNGQVDAS